MTLYLDTEFTELHRHGELLSLAMIDATGRWFYAEFTAPDRSNLSDWHQQNVVPYLALPPGHSMESYPGTVIKGTREEIVGALTTWLAGYDQTIVWADVPAYDWVFFSDLFGGALSMPKNLHYIVRDLATALEVKGYNPDCDRFKLAFGDDIPSALPRHNALADALALKNITEKLGLTSPIIGNKHRSG